MEIPQAYPLASISPFLASSSSSPSRYSISPVVAVFCFDPERFAELRFELDRDSENNELINFDPERFAELPFEFDRDSENNVLINFDLRTVQLFKLDAVQSLCVSEDETSEEQEICSRSITIQFRDEEESRGFHCAFEQWKKEVVDQGSHVANARVLESRSKFDDKIDASAAKMYFHYYGQLIYQQTMLEDYVRTGTYHAAVIENQADFAGRVVVDVGAGSGILSLFAAQAGAKHVYAVEASEMAEYARQLIAGNPLLGQRITVVKGKVEEVELPEKADILISEPMGTLLVSERMLESYVIARDRFLVPNGKMFPTLGRIHMAPFCDEQLYNEIANKALFWQQQDYFGVNMTPLHGNALEGYFSQPVVDDFDPRLLVAPAIFHVLNFASIKEEDLYEIDVPLEFIASTCTLVHGLACWFDVLFNGSTVQRWLTTSPGAPTTHWHQLRCVLPQPLHVMQGQEIVGRLHMIAHSAQSYTIHLTMSVKMGGPGAVQGGILLTPPCKLELRDPYYRMSQPPSYSSAEDEQPNQLIQTLVNRFRALTGNTNTYPG